MLKVFIIGFVFAFIACSPSKNRYNKNFKIAYIEAYKLQYYRKLLQTGFNNSNAINEILQLDRTIGMSDFYLTNEEQKPFDSLIKIDNMKMVKDSLESIGLRAEGAEGKRILGYAMKIYNSKWLYSLAKSSYKNYRKQMKEIEKAY